MTRINLNGIHELDFNLSGTTTASTSAGITTVNNDPAIATTSTVGVVKPDNNTIQIAPDGTISSGGAAPSFVQGAESTSSTSTMGVTLNGITTGNTLVFHLRCGNSTAPSWGGIGNPYVLVGSVASSFWGTYTYTYICLAALAGTEPIVVTGLVGGSSCILAEYTTAGGYEGFANNGVSANANTSSSLGITSTKGFERAVFFFTCGAFSGQTLNQTQRVPTSGASQAVLMDAPATAAGTTVTGTVTSAAMNQSAISGFFLSPLGEVQSVGLSMPSDFTVTGSPVSRTGVIQVTGGITKAGIQQDAYTSATDTGAANAYAITLVPTPTIGTNSEITFKAANATAGASTVTVNGTSYPLTKNGASPLVLGDILAGQMVTAKFDGTNFQTVIGSSVSAGVSSLNSLTGALTIAAGANVTVTPSGGSTLTIASSAGGGNNLYPGVTSSGTIPDISGWTAVNSGLFVSQNGGAGFPGLMKITEQRKSELESIEELCRAAYTALFNYYPSQWCHTLCKYKHDRFVLV